MKKLVLLTTLALSCFSLARADTLLGPTPYLSFADSPFSSLSFTYFYLEDFEDHLLNTPGVSGGPGGVASVVFGPSLHDSVDADDGTIDGSGLGGDDWFSGSGSTGVTFTFDAGALGGNLPTFAGIVWTDGSGQVTFQAFGPGNVLLGTIGPVSDANFPDGSSSGETAEDRFFGIAAPGGISSIFISNSSGGIEVDHLQYGFGGVLSSICGHHTVHGHLVTAPPDGHNGVVSGVHHGQHGHTVAAGSTCPPHAPGHTPGLTAETAGEGLFGGGGGSQEPTFVAGLNQDGTLNGNPLAVKMPGTKVLPALRGSVVQLFGSATGLFLDERDLQAASRFTAPTAGSPLFYTSSLPEVHIGGVAAKVLFSGLAPGLKGVWQINVQIPDGVPAGIVPVSLTYGGGEVGSVSLAIH